jgi:hypothetical protein
LISFRGRTHSISSIHWQLELLGLIESEALVRGVDRFGLTQFSLDESYSDDETWLFPSIFQASQVGYFYFDHHIVVTQESRAVISTAVF